MKDKLKLKQQNVNDLALYLELIDGRASRKLDKIEMNRATTHDSNVPKNHLIQNSQNSFQPNLVAMTEEEDSVNDQPSLQVPTPLQTPISRPITMETQVSVPSVSGTPMLSPKVRAPPPPPSRRLPPLKTKI